MIRYIALLLAVLISAPSTLAYAESSISGELQIRSKVDPDTIKIKALEKKIKAQKALITSTETAIKYVESKIVLAKKSLKSTKILDKKLSELQKKLTKEQTELKSLIKKLALLLA